MFEKKEEEKKEQVLVIAVTRENVSVSIEGNQKEVVQSFVTLFESLSRNLAIDI